MDKIDWIVLSLIPLGYALAIAILWAVTFGDKDEE